MSKYTDDYERVVKELVSDPESYDSWSDEAEEDEIKMLISEVIWGNDD